jgi:dTDP-glucose 4,6-dehydratase
MPDIESVFILDKLTYAGNLSRIENELKSPKVEFIHADLLDTSRYAHIISRVDTLIHFAAESHVDRSIENGYPFMSTNVLGTYALLETARANEDIRIIHVSTDEVYGSVATGESLEDDLLLPSSPYSSSKASSDLVVLSQHHTYGQSIVVTRCCNNYGPWQDNEKVIPNFITHALKGTPMPVYGTGMNLREWIHVRDHVDAILKLVDLGAAGEIYNIGTGLRITNLDLAEMIAGELGIARDFYEFVPDRLGHDFRYALNANKIRSLGWAPTINLESGLADTISWYKEQMVSRGGLGS